MENRVDLHALAGIQRVHQQGPQRSAVFATLCHLNGNGVIRRRVRLPLDNVFDAQIGSDARGAAPGERVPLGTVFINIR